MQGGTEGERSERLDERGRKREEGGGQEPNVDECRQGEKEKKD
jgi:hypothetical protein